MIFVIDDDEIMAECVARAAGQPTRIFTNAVEAMNALAKCELPKMIFLDILLDGPDGFAFLNELKSYSDTAQIPVVIVSSLDFKLADLGDYGVVATLKKDEMTPQEIKTYVARYA